MSKFVVLTAGNMYAAQIVKKLRGHGIIPTVVLPRRECVECASYLKAVVKDLVSVAMFEWYAPTILTGQMNSPEMVSTLEEIQPDYIILGGSGIIKPSIIKVPTNGVLNAHPGLLPWFRNVGVVGCALMHGAPVGSTIHYVDEGIDTGSIIERRLLSIQPKWTLEDIEREADQLSIQMLVDWAHIINTTNVRPYSDVQVSEQSVVCKWLTKEQRRELDKKISDGYAYDIYCMSKWKICNSNDVLKRDVSIF